MNESIITRLPLIAIWSVAVLLCPLQASARDDTDLAGLGDAQNSLVEMIRARDALGISELFVKEGVMVLADGTVLVGPANISEYWTERWSDSDGVNPLREYPMGTLGSGTLVMDGGGYGPDSLEQPIGEYARVWERDEDNAWRIRMFFLSR